MTIQSISAGHHGVTEKIQFHLLPILEVNIFKTFLTIHNENNVDMYINGYDHCLEHTSSSGIEFLTTAGGSKAWRGDVKWRNPEELL
ncbi:hypothetical protein Patl1_15650 [Pistacia atlantica]|uniref:Uncharacterized protein n=1 Tax=Pistacia atlantica TaxID=434234 RepID=A0ACC1B8B2_9ROSI|nr:hypothetical protein Patl1_15650 [Pistacia atlantica]